MKNQIIGGAFQDASGRPLSLGYITMRLIQDSEIISGGQLSSNIVLKIPLDSTGSIVGTVSVWPNDQLLPSGSTYVIKGYTASGGLVYGPAYISITSSPSPYPLTLWVP